MDRECHALLESAKDALKVGEWSVAEAAFRALLERGETGEALFGFGIARWWSGDTREALRSWERAYSIFVRVRDAGQAVLAAVYLCLAYRMSLGNDSAARGWLARAAALVDDFELTALDGWVLLCRAYLANDSGQPRAAEVSARGAVDAARRNGDVDLALCAACELGAALVAMGRGAEGVVLLDQAMAAALAGEGEDLDTVVLISCRTIASCDHAADITRALQWIRAADDFNRRYGSTHLFTTCRIHHGGVLFAVGQWDEAERELYAALAMGGIAEPALYAAAVAKLAELRLAQGRVEEAERLLAGLEDQPATAYAHASLQLIRGAAGAAVSLARRRLRELDESSVEVARWLELLTEADLLRGNDHGPSAQLLRVVDADIDAGRSLVVAHSERALGRAFAAAADATAVEHLEKALSSFAALEMPYECGRTRLLIASTVLRDDRETAIVEARLALACFEQLGAARDADAAAALLRVAGVKAARIGPKRRGLLTTRELEILRLLGEGLSNPDIARRLFISRKTAEHHVANVLSKLGLRSRGEAAAYALRHLEPSPATK